MNRPRLALIAICAAFVVASLFALHDLSLYNPDSTRYLVWAKSLATFHGFRDYTSPEAERYVIHAPLYALVLAPVSLLFGGSIIGMKIWTLCFGLAGIAFMYKWVCDAHGHAAAVTAAILIAANSLYWLFSTEILSDVPFFALMIGFFLLSEKHANRNLKAPAPLGSLILLGFVLSACLLMREIGVALVLAAAVHASWKKDWQRLALCVEIPGVLYLLWWFRNEFIVGRAELPALTNGKMFSRRYYTMQADPFVKELLARITTNASIYFHRIGETLFYPMYNGNVYDVVYHSSAAFQFMFGLVRTLAPLLIAITLAGIAAGMYRDFKSSKTFGLKIVFLFFYFAILACYPINDLRFLLPLVAFAVYYFAAGIAWAAEFAYEKKGLNLKYVGVALAIVLSVPNFFWNYECIAAVRSYHNYFAATENESPSTQAPVLEAGSIFAKPFRLAGEWIAAHSPPGIVMLSQLKDVAYWVGDRKLLNVNETISVTDLDDYLRDYNVTFLVAGRFSNGLREFEFQMDVSPRYTFDLVKRIGAIDIYHVVRHPRGWRAQIVPDTSTPFLRGLACLQRRDYANARSLFQQVLRIDTLNYAALFFTGIADEFAGRTDEAMANYAQFQYLPQAGMYLDAAQIHEEYVQARNQADADPDPENRSQTLLQLSGAYWQQGFHTQAKDLLAQIFRADSSNLGAYAYGMYFAIDDGDAATARAYLDGARRHFSQENVVVEYGKYIVTADSLRAGLDTTRREQQLLALGAALHSIGIEHAAEDVLLEIMNRFPADRDAANMLDELYEGQRRFAPAERILRIHLAADPADAGAKNLLSVLEGRLGA